MDPIVTDMIRLDVADGVAVITFDRADKRRISDRGGGDFFWPIFLDYSRDQVEPGVIDEEARINRRWVSDDASREPGLWSRAQAQAPRDQR